MTTFPTYAELAGHTFADVNGAGLTHRNWMANVGAAFAGTPIVRAFPFAYNTPNILTGAALYTPTVGDILIDGWIVVDTAWDGTTPRADFGFFVAAVPLPGFHDTIVGSGTTIDMTAASLATGYGMQTGSQPLSRVGGVPQTFVTADSLCICVSQDGTTSGANPAATHGAAHLYLITATPR